MSEKTLTQTAEEYVRKLGEAQEHRDRAGEQLCTADSLEREARGLEKQLRTGVGRNVPRRAIVLAEYVVLVEHDPKAGPHAEETEQARIYVIDREGAA